MLKYHYINLNIGDSFMNLNILNENAPPELNQLLLSCKNDEDLIKKVKNDPSLALTILHHMKLEQEENQPLASKLLLRIDPNELKNPLVKKVEETLRNRGMLNRLVESDMSFGDSSLVANKFILALESPYFMGMRGFKEFLEGKVSMEEGIEAKSYQHVLDYLYLPDQKRKEFISAIDKALLPEIALLASTWELDELTNICDDELCNSLTTLTIDKDEIQEWIERENLFPKFSMLLEFISIVAAKNSLESIIEQMQTPEGAAQLACKCTQQEIVVFSSLKTEFGKACQIPPGTFGKAEWEKTFPVTIEEVPPLPPNIHAILEQKDPNDPSKKVKESYQLFLRPEYVTLHEKEGSKVVLLNFDGVEELAKKATNEKFRMKYFTHDELREQMNKQPVAKAGWVLIRKEVIPATRKQDFEYQKKFLKGNVEVPLLMDAILLNILIYASEGKCLYGREPSTYTRCQEKHRNCQTLVGGLDPSGELAVDYYDNLADWSYGLAASWKL